jgi:hypothetical protein
MASATYPLVTVAVIVPGTVIGTMPASGKSAATPLMVSEEM